MKTTDYNILAEFTFSSKNFRKIFRKRPENVLKISVDLYARILGFIFPYRQSSLLLRKYYCLTKISTHSAVNFQPVQRVITEILPD